jgi:hypothetical protein
MCVRAPVDKSDPLFIISPEFSLLPSFLSFFFQARNETLFRVFAIVSLCVKKALLCMRKKAAAIKRKLRQMKKKK